MHLIFVRHGDPDYAHDTVTSKGVQEAMLLKERAVKWQLEKAYISPLGRAQKTAEIALSSTVEKETLPWLREFNYPIKDPTTGKNRIAWDWIPEKYFSEKKYFDKDKWCTTKAMKSGNISDHYKDVCDGIDSVLATYGYEKEANGNCIYVCKPHCTEQEAAVDHHLEAYQKPLDDRSIAFFCHLGVMFAVIGHLTGISPVQLWQGFFVAPTSVTVVGTEERVPGKVIFRVQSVGDCSHLVSKSEPPSASGYFGNCFAY